jgi:hypothetical protein
MEHSNKPIALLLKTGKKNKRPKQDGDDELDRDAAEIATAQKKIEGTRLRNEDKMAKKLGTYYITNASFPFLVTKSGFTMSVSQYYPAMKLAVDKFYNWNSTEIKEAEFKEKAFTGSGIKYVYLNPNKRLEDVI